MKFVWDEKKRKANLQKHGLDFIDAEKIFSGATFSCEDDRFPYNELRFIIIGLFKEHCCCHHF